MSIPDFFAEAPVTGPTAPGRVKPYGLLGLIISTAGILLLGAAIMAALGGVWIAVAGLDEVQRDMGSLSGIDINELRTAPYRTQIVMFTIVAASFIGFGLAVLAFARLRGGADWRIPLAWDAPTGWPTGKWLLLLPMFGLFYLLTAGFGIKLIFSDFRTWFFIPAGGWGMALSFVTVVLLAPWAEELLFRGWIYSSLRHSFVCVGWDYCCRRAVRDSPSRQDRALSVADLRTGPRADLDPREQQLVQGQLLCTCCL